MTKLLLDSGDPKEYREIAKLAKDNNAEIWGATTNPTLIAKTLKDRKLTPKEAFDLQKEIVMEILQIVPGAVSAEVYADATTKAEEMIEQGRDIATWDSRIYVKLPTTLEGFKARTALRAQNIPVNNTLVFSQEQIFAITLHEKIMRATNKIDNPWPPFISPFVGRLDDGGENGMDLVKNGMKQKEQFKSNNTDIVWMLAASIRKAEHMKLSFDSGSETITAPAKAYQEWFALSPKQMEDLDTDTYAKSLKNVPYLGATQEMLEISTVEDFMLAIESNKLNISHPLTDRGIERFAADWKAILASNL